MLTMTERAEKLTSFMANTSSPTEQDFGFATTEAEYIATELEALERLELLEEELDTIASDNAWDTFRNLLNETI